ncbi:hypothetical protein [Ruegeria jejuensis]|uniref:hypothetical protein n=1 Tax=Ruegeria jejuensis TaxID=3233338 RepID=UPI00355C40D2
MNPDAYRVVLKRDNRIFVDGADTGFTWVKTSGSHPEYQMRDERGVNLVNHYRQKTFKLKVLDFHNGCGEFS